MKKNNYKKISILTLNTGLFQINLFKISNFINERIRYLPNELLSSKADIICLQEVFLKSHRKILIKELNKIYPYYACTKTKWFKMHNGLMIFSKFQLENINFTPFKNKKYIFYENIFLKRGILNVDIKYIDNENIHITNIHTTPSSIFLWQDHKKILQIRKNQLEQTIKLSKENSKYSIIAWDFNAWPEIAYKNYEILKKHKFIDTYAKKNIKPLTTWNNNNYLNKKWIYKNSISQRIDHIFLSEDLYNKIKITNSKRIFDIPNIQVKNKKITISDHYWVITTLEFK